MWDINISKDLSASYLHFGDGSSYVFQTLVLSCHITIHHNLEDHDLNLYCHENLESCLIVCLVMLIVFMLKYAS